MLQYTFLNLIQFPISMQLKKLGTGVMNFAIHVRGFKDPYGLHARLQQKPQSLAAFYLPVYHKLIPFLTVLLACLTTGIMAGPLSGINFRFVYVSVCILYMYLCMNIPPIPGLVALPHRIYTVCTSVRYGRIFCLDPW
jgi:hypothetical protein